MDHEERASRSPRNVVRSTRTERLEKWPRVGFRVTRSSRRSSIKCHYHCCSARSICFRDALTRSGILRWENVSWCGHWATKQDLERPSVPSHALRRRRSRQSVIYVYRPGLFSFRLDLRVQSNQWTRREIARFQEGKRYIREKSEHTIGPDCLRWLRDVSCSSRLREVSKGGIHLWLNLVL